MAALCLTACGSGSDQEGREGGGSAVVGTAPPATGGIRSVVTLSPDPPGPSPIPTEPAVMDQYAIAFIPRLLVARPGQPVEFRNSEEVSHNVRVVEIATDSLIFSVNPVMGEPYVHTFDRHGAYAVVCDIHPGMLANLVVVTEPYAAVAAEDGAFSFDQVPPGRYRARVWSIDAALQSEQRVDIVGDTTRLQLEGGG